MIKTFIKKYYLLIILLIINIIVHWCWVSNLQYITYGDSGIYLPETQKELVKNSVQIYESNLNFGLLSLNAGYKVIEFFQGILAQLGIFYNISFRILFLWPYVFLSPIAAYFIFSKFIKLKIDVFIAALVYLFSTYILLIQTGHILVLLGSLFLTFALLFSYKFYIESNSSKNYGGLIFFLFLLSSYEFRIFYIGVFVIGLLVLYKFTFIKKSFKDLWSYIGAILFVILLNFYWLFPLLSENKVTSNELFSRSLFGNNFFDISSSLTFFHRFWTGGSPTIFIRQPIPFYFWLIPIFAILSLVPKKKNPFLLYFALLALVGIFLTKQSGEPFPNAYQWLYNHFPGFNAFRETSKFYFLIALGYSVLIGTFVSWLWENWNKQKWQIYGKYFLTFLVIAIFLWNTKPIITDEMGTLFVPRHIPSEYIILKDFVLKQPEYFRTMWTPRDSRWGIFTNQKPKISNVAVIEKKKKKNISLEPEYNNLPENKKITEIFKIKGANELFDISSIKYVIVPIRDFTNEDDFFIYYGGSENANIREWYISELDKVEWLKKIDIGTKDLVTYENENFRPHIYMTKEQETIYQKLPYEKVDFEQKNPSEYKVHLKNVSEPFYLNFSESYHPDWGVKIGNFNWFSAILGKNYFLKGENHMKNNAGLNSFYIDLSSISNNNNCTKNEDGSYNFDLTLYFKPQSYFYLGLIISGTTLVGITGYLLYDFKKRRKLQNKEIKKIL